MKRINRDAVLADAIKRLREWRQSAGWLQEAAPFDHNCQLLPKAQLIAARLFDELMTECRGYKLNQKKEDLEVLFANLLRNKLRCPISISLNRNDWTPKRFRRASYFVVEKAIHMLLKADLIEMRKGYGHEVKTLARRTKIWPASSLLEAFESVRTEDWVIEPVDLITLRDEAKNPVDYKDTKETNRVREILRKANTVTDRALVQYIDPKSRMAYRLKTRLHCVYNRDFQHGGRFYTAGRDGDHYQSLSEEERKCIQIDGELTVELDFSGLHPRLLYAWEGIQYDGDPYSAATDDPRIRELLKVIFLALLNSRSEEEAVKAGNYHLYQCHRDYMALRRRGLKVKDNLIPIFKAAHEPIVKYFCSGTGARAQNVDAKIALNVIAHFASCDIPVLAIHDSFIVQRRYAGRLRKVMDRAYKAQAGGFTCPIK